MHENWFSHRVEYSSPYFYLAAGTVSSALPAADSYASQPSSHLSSGSSSVSGIGMGEILGAALAAVALVVVVAAVVVKIVYTRHKQTYTENSTALAWDNQV